MSANFPEVKDATLKKLCTAIFDSTRQSNGSVLATFVDRLGTPVTANSFLSGGVASATSQAGPGREVILEVRINPDGTSAYAKIKALNPAGLQSVEGQLDTALLATHLT